MNIQRYLIHHDPCKLTGAEITEFRRAVMDMLQSGNEAAVLAAISLKKLLNHIDYMTMEASKQ